MTAYAAGVRAGRADRLLGRRSDYAFYGVLDAPGSYTHEYALGYRAGLEGRA